MRPKASPVCFAMPCVSTSHGRDAELAAHDERDADAVEEQPDEELHEATDEHGCGVGGSGEA